jgi:hypothetical protein
MGLVVILAACGGDDGGSGQPIDAPAPMCTTPTNNIAGNHGHVLTVTLADVDAAADKTYDIMGTATHTHAVTITAAQFADIKAGETRTFTSTSAGGHSHQVTVMCVS